jgi:hypothetical protein
VASQVLRGAICAVLIAGPIAGCGGRGGGPDNGVAAKPPNVIVQEANHAISSASSVHVAGSISNNSVPLTLDLNLVAGKGGTGALSEAGLSFRVITVAQDLYIQGTRAFWSHFQGPAVARQFGGRWLQAPASGQFAPIAALTNQELLFGKVLLSHGRLKKVGITTVNGQRVVGVRDSTAGDTIYVAATGKPYPVEIVKRGSGRIVFDRVNQPVVLKPPAHFRSLPH